MTATPTRRQTERDTFTLEPMRAGDIDEVRLIERQCFPTPWPKESFRYELERNRMAHYLILRRDAVDGEVVPEPIERPGLFRRLFRRNHVDRPTSIVGFAGLWLMVDEAHITTLAIAPDYQGKGLGELLLVGVTEVCAAYGAKMMTLEVRPSNAIAQKLYGKYGFTGQGVRPHYYSDDGEDALVMWSEEIGSTVFQDRFKRMRVELRKRVTWESKL